MKFLLLPFVLLLGGLNLILARSIYWGPYNTYSSNPWWENDYDYDLLSLPSRQNSVEEKHIQKIADMFAKSSEDSKESGETKTGNEPSEEDDTENLKTTQLKEIENFLSLMGYNSNEDESKENTKEKKDSNEGDSDNEKDNTAENDKDDTDSGSEEQKAVEVTNSSEEEKPESKNDSKESNESPNAHNTDEEDEMLEETIFSNSQLNKFADEKLEDKDIGNLIAVVWTISTMDDLMKLNDNTSENEVLTEEDLKEKKLKEVSDYLKGFGSLWNKVLSEYLEKEIETEKLDNVDDSDSKDAEGKKDNDADDDKNNSNDSKENDNDTKPSNQDQDASVSFEFQDIENSKTNLIKHRYDILHSPIAADAEFKPTSFPYIPDNFSLDSDNSNVIQEYVKARERIDTVQEDLLLNKLSMDKAFYDIIANEMDDKNMHRFASDIDVLRESAYKIKHSVDDMQDIKSKLYLHSVIKAALREAHLK